MPSVVFEEGVVVSRLENRVHQLKVFQKSFLLEGISLQLWLRGATIWASNFTTGSSLRYQSFLIFHDDS